MMRKNSAAFVAFIWCLMCVGVSAEDNDDILSQKNELEQIHKDVEASRQKLDSLKHEELRAQKQMAEFDQKITGNKKVVARLSKELEKLKASIAKTEAQLDENAHQLERAHLRFLGNLRRFYVATRRHRQIITDDPNEELELTRQVVYLSALAGFESGSIAQAEDYLAQSQMQLAELAVEGKKVTRLKKSKETAATLEKSKKTQQQKALEQLRQQKLAEADRILTLEQAATEMERIIGRLEQEQAQLSLSDERQKDVPSALAALRGQLMAPCRGNIVVAFGHSVDPITKLRSFSPGIGIKGSAGRSVVAAADGTVAYNGNLRGYGNFVIIKHDDQYYTTYGGLEQIRVEAAEYVLAGAQLGVAGSDGLVKFELRRGREPLDPVAWIRIDSF